MEWSILSSEYKKSGIQWSTLGVRVFKEKSIWEQEKNLKTTLEKKSEKWKITFISRLIYEFNAYEKIEIKTLFIYLKLVIDWKKGRNYLLHVVIHVIMCTKQFDVKLYR